MPPYDPARSAVVERGGAAALTEPEAARPASVGRARDRFGALLPVARAGGRRTAAVDVTAVIVLAVLMRLVFAHSLPLGDPAYALVWGRDLVHGRLPDLGFALGPTAHPLAVVETAVAATFGRQGAIDALLVVSYGCLGSVLWGTFRLGEAVFTRLTGVLAMVIVASSATLVVAAVEAYLDLPYLALVVWAAVLEARKPRRGISVFVLLALAGLLRPEAWVLAGVYWLYAGGRGRRRWVSALLVAAAPAGWLLMGLVLAGDPLYAVRAQQHVVQASVGHAQIGVSQYLSAAVSQLRLAIHAPVLASALPGFALAVGVRRRGAAVPLAVLVLVMATYVAFIVIGVAIPDRMLLTPAIMLALLGSYAICGWTAHGRRIERRAWAALGLVLLALIVVAAPGVVSDLRSRADRWSAQMRALSDLRALSYAPSSRQALKSCPTVRFGAPLVAQAASPYLAYYVPRPLRAMGVMQGRLTASAAIVVPRRAVASLLVFGPQIRQATRVPPDSRPVAQNASWRLYTRSC